MLTRPADIMTTIGTRAVRRLTVVAAALLIVVAAGSKESRASCGDYLSVGGTNHAMGPSARDAERNASAPPLRSLCNGPQCGRTPSAPAPPRPSTQIQNQQERACLEELSDLSPASPFCGRVTDGLTDLAAGFPFRVERPPQA